MGMAQLIEGNLKVNTNCGADIKVKGEKIKKTESYDARKSGDQ